MHEPRESIFQSNFSFVDLISQIIIISTKLFSVSYERWHINLFYKYFGVKKIIYGIEIGPIQPINGVDVKL